ncbi:MAG: lipopolysaccharide biosynthesis protein RfbH [Methanomassiliicoccales archaeon]|jgi:CDP-6-deoxy-D-xylo-4-hexulose-3-dehydrase
MSDRANLLTNPDLDRSDEAKQLRQEIVDASRRYAELVHGPKPFVPGKTWVPVSGKIMEGDDAAHLVSASLDMWLTTGRFNDAFERRLAEFMGVKFALTTNSGSSANLLAVSGLTSTFLGESRLRQGDEVVTVAAGFPTTVNPIIQNGLVPVFVDVSLPTYNVDVDLIEEAITDRTKLLMFAHTLGNPFDLRKVAEIARRHDLLFVEDCCDSLGSLYQGRMVGTFGTVSTLSFYPAHHITMGEGGAVMTNSPDVRRSIESMRDWGRDCHCPPGRDNTCGNRYNFQMGDLPAGYDHKYIYSNVGYNLKITDMQAAVGLSQLDRADSFVRRRKENFRYLSDGLKDLDDSLVLPKATKESDPSWFGFPITMRRGERRELLKFLDDKKIGNRLLFGGNLTRQPYFKGLNYRISGELKNTDTIMNHTLWVGVWPGLSEAMLDHIVTSLHQFFERS